MRLISSVYIILITIVIGSCVSNFIPETDEGQNLVVVEGLITDQPEPYTIKVSWSIPVGTPPEIVPLKGCTVTVRDDVGNQYSFIESKPGYYISDPSVFQGVVGRIYTLYINTNNATPTHYSYESRPVEMKAVPPIDSLYYERVTIQEATQYTGPQEGCQIYLNTFDPTGNCRYYRWDYTETWRFRLPYLYPKNNVCFITNNSTAISIKNTSVLEEDRVTKLPVKFVSNETDRLSDRYSILVNQYSLNEDEYSYWEKVMNISQDVGGLYDLTPASVVGNISCVEDSEETVLGFFSVSSKSSERIYVDETFRGLVQLYNECPADTVYNNAPIAGLDVYVWIIIDNFMPPYKVITKDRGCADCTLRGTITEPEFWED